MGLFTFLLATTRMAGFVSLIIEFRNISILLLY